LHSTPRAATIHVGEAERVKLTLGAGRAFTDRPKERLLSRLSRRARIAVAVLAVAVCLSTVFLGASAFLRPRLRTRHRIARFQAAQRDLGVLLQQNRYSYSRSDIRPFYEIIRSLSQAQVTELVTTRRLPCSALTPAQQSLWRTALERIPPTVRQVKGYRAPLAILYLAANARMGRPTGAVAFWHLPYDDGPPCWFEMGLPRKLKP
jgi:hypothetical protein